MNRDQYIAKLKADLDRWNAQAQVWQAKARSARADLRAGYERRLVVLRARSERAAQKLREVQSASAAAWHDMADGADQAWQQLRAAFARARAQFDREKREDGA